MPRRVTMHRREKDGTYSKHRVYLPTNKEIYEGKERLAIVDALNVLGKWHSPLEHLPEEHRHALLGEDYEWGEAYQILYGALGIDLSITDSQSAYEAYLKIRDEEWDKRLDGRDQG